MPTHYPDQLERLEFPALHGFLKGYIDLVFEHEKRFYVVDYKSNFLGASRREYGPTGLSEAMAHGHYFLQAHLYCVALHRHLSLRLRSYDYERDFGGLYYLFLKGMSPKTGARTGVFADRPKLEMIEAIDRLLGGTS